MTYRSAIKKKGPLKKSALSLETEHEMATWRAERTVCRKGELIFPGRSENAPTVFFFWLISVSGICRETQRNQGKRANSRDHMSPLCVSPSFPFPVLALGLGFFLPFSSERFFSERGRSARGLVSAPAAAAPEPRPMASVERRVEAEARRHQRQAEQS